MPCGFQWRNCKSRYLTSFGMTPGGFAVKAFASGALGKRRAVRQDHERPGASDAVVEIRIPIRSRRCRRP